MAENGSFEKWIRVYKEKGGGVQPATLRKVKVIGELSFLLPRLRDVQKSYYQLTVEPLAGVIEVVKRPPSEWDAEEKWVKWKPKNEVEEVL